MRAAAHQALQQLLVRRSCAASAPRTTRLSLGGARGLPPRPPSSPTMAISARRSLRTDVRRRLFAPSIFPGGHRGRRGFSDDLGVRAAQVNDPGSIDSPMMQAMENKLNADIVIVKDAYGDGRHVSIDVVSSAFEGQSAVNRQRMVYKAIWEELQSTVHAVDQMITRTPSEAAGNN
uniref:BolA-like protein 1 n=1 Tax=Anthurium amnicola TaxID=1678845 RepID=A0A1D1Y9W2_9ARAE